MEWVEHDKNLLNTCAVEHTHTYAYAPFMKKIFFEFYLKFNSTIRVGKFGSLVLSQFGAYSMRQYTQVIRLFGTLVLKGKKYFLKKISVQIFWLKLQISFPRKLSVCTLRHVNVISHK